MAKTDFQSVDDYLATLPAPVQAVLAEVRVALRAALPDATECISYQIPTLKVGGKAVVYYAGFKEHWSVLPASQALLDALGDELRPRLHGKATLRFGLTEPVPVDLLHRVAAVQLAEVAARPVRKRR